MADVEMVGVKIARELTRMKNGMTFTYRRYENGDITSRVTYGDVVIAPEHPVIMDIERVSSLLR